MNVHQKKKQKKNAIISTLGPHCNPKHKKDLDEDPDDCNVPHPPDVSASATSSTQDTTVSHFNASRKDIDIDGRKYRCNKVKVRGEIKNVVYVKYLQCWMAVDKANGSKWKPYNKVKASSSTEKVWCFGLSVLSSVWCAGRK
jgi:hypothetical protein